MGCKKRLDGGLPVPRRDGICLKVRRGCTRSKTIQRQGVNTSAQSEHKPVFLFLSYINCDFLHLYALALRNIQVIGAQA